MGLADLAHSPEFDLPSYGPAYPDDVLNLLECHHEGLYKVIVSKMITRGKYEQIASVTCQREPGRKKHPIANSEEIAEYCMLCVQYEIEQSDVRGIYRIALHGPPGKGGGWMKSKHIDLTDQDADARSVSMLSEGELIEQQNSYISELHSQIIACVETVQGVVKPILDENKQMMKIVADAQRNLTETEQVRLSHDLNMRIHEDEKAKEAAAEEQKMERWRELMGLVKDTGAAESLLNGLINKFLKPRDAVKALTGNDKPKNQAPVEEKKDAKADEEKTKRDAPTEDEREKKIYEEALERVGDNPLVMAAEALKMSIDEKRQWKSVYRTLHDSQAEKFDDIFSSRSDEEIKGHVNELVEIEGLDKLLELNKHLDEQQQKFVKLILSVVD